MRSARGELEDAEGADGALGGSASFDEGLQAREGVEGEQAAGGEVADPDAGLEHERAHVVALEVREQARQRYLKLGWPDWFAAIYPYAARNLQRIHAAGGLLVLGTDRSFAPAALRELELVVAAGIPPLDALRIATLNGAIFLGRESELGSIEPGKLADMVLLNADPTRDIRNVREIAGVWKAGVAIDRATLQLPINGRP